MGNLSNFEHHSIKQILELIECKGLSKIYSIANIEDGEKLGSYNTSDYLSRSNYDADNFVKVIKEEIPMFSRYIYMKNVKSKLPKLLHSVGYLIEPKAEDEIDLIYVKKQELYEKIDIIIHKKFKNNLLIIGEPGTGKTTLIRQYAKFKNLDNMFVVECAKLIGDCSLRGSFEQKVVDVIEYARKNNLILFFDEIHSLIDLGNSIGGMSISDILKPYLTDNDLIFIGATTTKEANILLEDEAFKRRFSTIQLKEPTTDELLSIKNNFFKKNKEYTKYNLKDDVTIEVIKKLEEQLPKLFFPDKFVDFIDYYTSFKSISNSLISLDNILKEYIYDYK